MNDIKVSVQELLSVEPFTGCEMLGGWNGKQNIIGEITTKISDGKMVGQLFVLNLHELNSQICSEMLAKVLNKSVSGIFLIGTSEPYLQKDISDHANDNNIPIIFSRGIDDILVIKENYQLIKYLKEKDLFLKYVQSSNDYMVTMVNEEGVQALINHLEVIIDNPIMVVDPFFNLIKIKEYPHNDLLELRGLLKFIRQSFYKKQDMKQDHSNISNINRVEVKINDDSEGLGCYICNLKAGKTNHGYMIVEEKNSKLTELNLIQLKKAVAPIISELIKYREILETEKKYKDNFIYDLLNNNFESYNSIVKQGKIWGWNLAKPHQLLIMEIYKENKSEIPYIDKILHIINNALSSFLQKPISLELSDQIVVLIPDENEKNRKERKEYIKSIGNILKEKINSQIPDASLSIGIGRYYHSTTHLSRSYQEAKTALELGKLAKEKDNITHFEDLGMMRLLASIRQEQLDDFYQEYLGELIAFDEKNVADLVVTLQTYFAENGNLKATADKLFVHTNTLRYRLKKIEKLLAIDFERFEDLLNLFVTLKIISMRR